jgi:hypothetical protein
MVIRAHWMFFLMLTALPVAHQDAAYARETAAPRYWELDDTKDPMTDRVTRSVGSDVVFADGRLVQVSAVCDDLGIQFSFDAFRYGEGIAFAWRRSDDERVVGLRVRIDAGAIRTAVATQELANEATIIFYDPLVATRVVAATLSGGQGQRPAVGQLFGGLSEVVSGAALAEFDRKVAGKLAELDTAQSLRVELPLADGTNDAILIDLTEPALSAYVHQCIADGRASNGR